MTADVAAPPPAGSALAGCPRGDRRGSWIPTGAMIATRFMELRKRRGLMAALIGVTIGIPTVFLVVRLVLHAVAPKTYGPAGGYNVFTHLVAGVLYVFGFIVAATLGCAAGSADLTDGMFRHLVVTGRSRLALYFARIPAGLAIIVPMVAIGFTIVCGVCAFAAPTTLNYQGVKRARRPVTNRTRALGRRPRRCSHLQLRVRRTAPGERALRQRPQQPDRQGSRREDHQRTDRERISRARRFRAVDRRATQGSRRADRESGLRGLLAVLPVSVELAHGQGRSVDRARSRDRIHRRPRVSRPSSDNARSRWS